MAPTCDADMPLAAPEHMLPVYVAGLCLRLGSALQHQRPAAFSGLAQVSRVSCCACLLSARGACSLKVHLRPTHTPQPLCTLHF